MARPHVTQLCPPFTYYGGKITLGPTIAALLPRHEHYVEPYAGSLAVLLAKRPSRAETVNDLDRDLVTFWRVLRDRPEDLAHAAALTPHSRAEYQAACEPLEELDDLERARRTWVRITQGRSMSLDVTGWKYGRDPIGRSPVGKGRATFVERIPPAARRLAFVTLECRDALDVIRDYGTEPTVCLYADPPYLGSTRSGSYRHDLKADAAHVELAEALNACRASVVLSGYASPLYEDLFAGWHRTDLKAPTTLAGARSDVPEVLWSNVPLAAQDTLDII